MEPSSGSPSGPRVFICKGPGLQKGTFEANEDETFKGALEELSLRTPGGLTLTAIVTNKSAAQEPFRKGDRVWCSLPAPDSCPLFKMVVREQLRHWKKSS